MQRILGTVYITSIKTLYHCFYWIIFLQITPTKPCQTEYEWRTLVGGHHPADQSSVKGSWVIFGRRSCAGGSHVVASPRTHQSPVEALSWCVENR